MGVSLNPSDVESMAVALLVLFARRAPPPDVSLPLLDGAGDDKSITVLALVN